MRRENLSPESKSSMDGDTKHGPDRVEDDDPLAVTASTSPPEKEWAIDAESKWYRRYWFASAPVTLAAVALAPLRLAFCGDASTGAAFAKLGNTASAS